MVHQLGVNTWVWTSPLTNRTLAELAPQIADWGFNVIELPVENPGDWDPAQASQILSDCGLDATVVLVMGPGRELVRSGAATVTSTQDYLRHVIDVAVAVGSPVIAGPAYASVGRTWRMDATERAAVTDELRQHLGPVADHATAAGVAVGVEPLNRYETSLVNTVAQGLEVLEGLPESVGLALDVYHLNIEERDVPSAILAAADRLVHVQVCANDRGAPGADHLNWPGILDALATAGYRGPLVIESFTVENAAIATAASIWRPLARSQDAIATDGLAFLRGMLNAR